MCAGGPCSATDSGHISPSPITRLSLPLSGTGQASLQWSRFYPRAIRPRKVEFRPSYTPWVDQRGLAPCSCQSSSLLCRRCSLSATLRLSKELMTVNSGLGRAYLAGFKGQTAGLGLLAGRRITSAAKYIMVSEKSPLSRSGSAWPLHDCLGQW